MVSSLSFQFSHGGCSSSSSVTTVEPISLASNNNELKGPKENNNNSIEDQKHNNNNNMVSSSSCLSTCTIASSFPGNNSFMTSRLHSPVHKRRGSVGSPNSGTPTTPSLIDRRRLGRLSMDSDTATAASISTLSSSSPIEIRISNAPSFVPTIPQNHNNNNRLSRSMGSSTSPIGKKPKMITKYLHMQCSPKTPTRRVVFSVNREMERKMSILHELHNALLMSPKSTSCSSTPESPFTASPTPSPPSSSSYLSPYSSPLWCTSQRTDSESNHEEEGESNGDDNYDSNSESSLLQHSVSGPCCSLQEASSSSSHITMNHLSDMVTDKCTI